MSLKIKDGGEWKNLSFLTQPYPANFKAQYRPSTYDKIVNKIGYDGTAATIYENYTGKMLYVTASFDVVNVNTDTWATVAGTSAWAFVSEPNETSDNLDDYINVCRVRDNGTRRSGAGVYLNPQFFVPPDCRYAIKFYNKDLTPLEWPWNNRLQKDSWNELIMDLSFD